MINTEELKIIGKPERNIVLFIYFPIILEIIMITIFFITKEDMIIKILMFNVLLFIIYFLYFNLDKCYLVLTSTSLIYHRKIVFLSLKKIHFDYKSKKINHYKIIFDGTSDSLILEYDIRFDEYSCLILLKNNIKISIYLDDKNESILENFILKYRYS